MTQEEKLLLKDLCTRLPYGVKVWYKYYSENVTEKFVTSIRLVDGKIALSSKFNREGDWYPIEEANELLIKPYLRPMSSMTEEEKKDLLVTIVGNEGVKYFQVLSDGSIDNTDATIQDLNKFNMHWINFDIDTVTLYLDWLNAHHFDYRGLIPKGLALEAHDGMYEH